MISAIISFALAMTSANAADAAAAKPAKPKKVCEKVESTGSAVPKRICRTVVEPVKPREEATQAVADTPKAGASH